MISTRGYCTIFCDNFETREIPRTRRQGEWVTGCVPSRRDGKPRESRSAVNSRKWSGRMRSLSLSPSLSLSESSFAIGSSLGRYVEEAPKFPLSTSALEESKVENRDVAVIEDTAGQMERFVAKIAS